MERTERGVWKPGQSGNPAGRPIGSRNKFSERFVDDIAATWEKHGADILEKMAADEPARFAELCARIIPKDLSVTLSGQLPGGLDPEHWALALPVLEAVKEALPDAQQREPAEVLEFTRAAIRAASVKVVEPCTPVASVLPNYAQAGAKCFTNSDKSEH